MLQCEGYGLCLGFSFLSYVVVCVCGFDLVGVE